MNYNKYRANSSIQSHYDATNSDLLPPSPFTLGTAAAQYQNNDFTPSSPFRSTSRKRTISTEES